MLICLDMRTGAGCGAQTVNGAKFCDDCGANLRFALTLHDLGGLAGEYRIMRVIGYGAYGAVYEALPAHPLAAGASPSRPLTAGRVALKETFDARSISSFAREFRVLSGLDHANLPRYIDMFEAQGNGYLVMEYVPGQSLQEVLDEQAELLPESQVLGYALQLCDVLTYLHSQQPAILHRDIKPANIRLTPEGRIKLVDFGLLKQGGQQTRATIRGLGTLGYAPIEQYGNDERATDPRSDLYSLAATLYHLLTNQEPPAAPVRVTGTPDPLPALRDSRPTLSPHVALAISKALSVLPKDRFATLPLFKKALLGVTAPQPSDFTATPPIETPVAPSSPLQRMTGWIFKRDSAPTSAPQPLDANPYIASHSHHSPHRPLANGGEGAVVARADIVPAIHDMSLPHILCEGQHSLFGVALRADEVLGMSHEGLLYRWQVADGRLIGGRLLDDMSPPKTFACSPDGQVMATTGHDHKIRLWGMASQQLLHTLEGHKEAIAALVFSPDGQVLVSAGGKDKTLRFWRVQDGSLLKKIEYFVRNISSLAFSPNGFLLAAGADSSLNKIHLLRADAARGELLRKVKERTEALSMAWHPNGKFLASAGARRLSVWQSSDGERLHEFKGHRAAITSVVWHPKGSLVASASKDKSISIWALSRPFLRYKCHAHQDEINDLAFSADGSTLASASADKTVRLWLLPQAYHLHHLTNVRQDASLGGFKPPQRGEGASAEEELLKPIPFGQQAARKIGGWAGDLWYARKLMGGLAKAIITDELEPELTPVMTSRAYHIDADYNWTLPHQRCEIKGHILSLSYNNDGQHVLGIGSERQVYLWRVSDAQLLQTLKLEGRNTLDVVAVSPDGETIAGSNHAEMMIRLWDAGSGRLRYALRGHSAAITSLIFSPDGKQLASAGGEDETICLWQVSNGQLLQLLNHDSKVMSLAYSPNGEMIAASKGRADKLSLWRTSSGELLREFGKGYHSDTLAWHPAGELLANQYDNALLIWRVKDSRLFKRFKGHSGTLTHLAWSLGGTVLASASEDKTIRIWSLMEPALRHVCEGHQDKITALAYSPDGYTLASGSKDGTVRFWQMAQKEKQSLQMAKEGKLISSPPSEPPEPAEAPLRRFRGWFNRGDRGEAKKPSTLQQQPIERPIQPTKEQPIERPIQPSKEQIVKGWNGLDWGASISDFKANFPQASWKQNNWWVTGLEAEYFCDISMKTQYSFNNKGQFYLVAFYPKPEDRKRITSILLNHLRPPDRKIARWRIGQIEVEVKIHGIMVTITDQRLAAG